MKRYNNDEELNRAITLFSSAFPREANAIQTLTYMVMLFGDWLSTTVELCFRYNFGRKYLGFGRTILSALTFYVFILAYAAYNPAISPFPLTILGSGLGILWVIHRLRNFTQHRDLSIWTHDYFFGTSYLSHLPFLSSRHRVVYRLAEPLLIFVVGWVIFLTLNAPIGVWLIASSMALRVKNELVMRDEERIVADIKNARIEADYYAALLEGEAAQPQSPYATPHTTKSYRSNTPINMADTIRRTRRKDDR